MANNPQFKVNQLAKDLNIKAKDITDILAEKGIAVKSQAALEPVQFDVLLDSLTKQNQIDSIDKYMSGETYIPTKSAKAEAKSAPKAEAKTAPKAEAKAEPKAEVKAEPKAEVKAEPKVEAKAEPKVEAKAEPKVEVKAEPKVEVKAEPKVEVKAEPKVEAKVEAKPAPKAEPARQPKFEQNPRPAGQRDQRDQKPAWQQRDNGQQRDNRDNRDNRGNKEGFAQKRPAFDSKPQGANRPQTPFGNKGDRPQGDRPQKSFDRQGFNQYKDNDQFRDKDSGRQNAPREKFKPQPIVRTQTTTPDAAKRGATRVVDMRAESVDLSKYDEKLDTFVPDIVADARGGNVKVKKQQQQNNKMGMQQGGKMGKFQKGKKSSEPVTKAPTSVTLPEEIVVSDLASRLKVTASEIVKRLMMLGMMVTVNQTVDFDTAAIVADEMGIPATKEVVVTIEEKLFEDEVDDESVLTKRAPVVCVMGHVDHGKTSILDAIRHTRVTSGEAGGITQHIGAYRVKVNGEDITFLDTPGHEAFTAMRARGAQATDIAILVVAADDGIMPQTIEAINHAKAAGIDIIVAINKMDKPTANPDQVKQELTKYDLVPEEWGGDVICCPVSALTKQGIDDLLENVLLVAEVKELKANPARRAKGIIIEAKLDKGRGPVATVLVQNGTLRNGDIVIAGTAVGRVRAMTDHNGKNLKEAGPSVPVEIIGLADVPLAGDEFNAVEDERMARTLADQRKAKAKEETFKANARANLDDLFAQISEGVKELNVIVKADVGGSAEAVKQSLEKISNEEVKVRVIHAAAGGIREGDVMLASASNAIIVGFNVRPDKAAIDSAERNGVDIRTYRVIYDCINEITDAMKGMLAPEFKENLLGHAEVRQTIHVPNVGTIAGSYVQDGKVLRSAMIRVVRDGVVIFEDKISSLKRFKDDVKEVAQGYECGIGLDRFNDIKVGDVLEAYIMEEVKR